MKLLLSVELIDAAVRVVRIANTDRLASSSTRVKPRAPLRARAGLPMQRIGEATAAAFDESFMFESLKSCSVQLCVVQRAFSGPCLSTRYCRRTTGFVAQDLVQVPCLSRTRPCAPDIRSNKTDCRSTSRTDRHAPDRTRLKACRNGAG